MTRLQSIPGSPTTDARTHVVSALLFDLDGTLIDTEIHTDSAIRVVAERYGVAGFTLPPAETRGRTWTHIADKLRALTSIGAPSTELAAAMLEYWNGAVTDVNPVPGSPQAIRAAGAAGLKLAVVSSSPRSVIDYFLDTLGVGDCVDLKARIGADSVTRGKPDPEGFLRAARVLDTSPAECLVYEDSRAGLLAARGAGMRSMLITCCASDVAENAKLATACCTDYRVFPPAFWGELRAGSINLAGRRYS